MSSGVSKAVNYVTFFVFITLMVGVAWSGTTGKVSGSVEDSDGNPLPGAAVTVEGTRLGASTDADGRYVILLVPPGTHSVTANLIGYHRTTVAAIRVNTDLTSKIDFELAQSTIEVGAVVVTAGRPAIEVDVTSSQTIINADRVSEIPVNQMLDVLDFQPGVQVSRDNELEIRGGGPSEIRFQVDGIDRTDGLTAKSHTHLNQMLVSEVTLLTGGFNAEYGNVRSGMVNVVVKEGGEHGGLRPWIAGVYNHAPAQHKHFGPGAYDVDQYDYRVLTQSDSAISGGRVMWPDLYEETRNDLSLDSAMVASPNRYKVFDGWTTRVKRLNAKRLGINAAYGHTGWEVADLIEAWQYEANMNEVAWQYANEPDWGTDLAAGWGLPGRMGGIVIGYAYNKEMTAVPAVRNYYLDRSLEAKLTLTPTDRLKLRLSYLTANSEQPGSPASGVEAQDTKAVTDRGDPTALRSAAQLVSGVVSRANPNNKLNPTYLNPLDGSFKQWSGSITYTFGPNTFITASFGQSETDWDLFRPLPRADMMDPNEWSLDTKTTKYQPPSSFTYPGLLDQAFDYGEYEIPPNLDFAVNLDNLTFRSPFGHPNLYDQIPRETIFVSKEFVWDPRVFTPRNGDPIDTTYSVRIVSPQGFSPLYYGDLSGLFKLAGGGERVLDAQSMQTVGRFDLTHVVGSHTLKGGTEFIGRDLTYHYERSDVLIGPAVGGAEYRSYGNDYPAAQPKIFGMYLQDKYESDGMVTNVGLRVERFDAGQQAFMYNDLFNREIFGQNSSFGIYKGLVVEAGWDPAWGEIGNPENLWYAVNDSLLKHHGVGAPLTSDVVAAWPSVENEVHWQLSPRLGISHPVSRNTKFFFNYGIFYSMQKPLHMYGYSSHNTRPGALGRMEDVFNPSLRPSRTTMYEVGLEHVLPMKFVAKATGYAKYNTDQVTQIHVTGASLQQYATYRNANYEDVFGYELQLARTSGRYLNGTLTYERSSSRTGEVGYTVVADRLDHFDTGGLPYVRTNRPNGFLRLFVNLSTPTDMGLLRGGWSTGVVYEWQKGTEAIYNPEGKEQRELPDENFLPTADYWNVDMKFMKRMPLPGGRYVSAYLDIENVLNIKHLNPTGVDGYSSKYLSVVYQKRLGGEDVAVGDESTFDWLTRPYRIQGSNSWQAPISPHTEWLHHLNPRFVRFGVRFEI
jgi:hypothetical protein